ncbi:MAG: hypothetical protein HOP30_00555 [Cyclobacteriaceae bacterium]|jgi:hypothetical protein|nr:hypothetical protein [Cyclobacteriaceae bacterium]
MARKKIIVRKTSFEEEQKMKDDAFLKLKPTERLLLHEELRKKIWGDLYRYKPLKGMKVVKKKVH